MSIKTNALPLTPDDVIAYLIENPSFFEEYGQTLLKKMHMNVKQGENIVDLKAYFIKKLQDTLDNKEEMEQFLIEVSRTNLNNQNRVHTVVLEILKTKTLSDLLDRVTTDIAIRLSIDLVEICVEDHGQLTESSLQYLTPISKGLVDKILPDQQKVILRSELTAKSELYPQAEHMIKSDALARLSFIDFPAILVLASRHEDMFHPSQGTEHLLFLTRVIEIQLEKCLKIKTSEA